MNSPAVELFKYMELEVQKDEDQAENKKAEMYIQYLSQIFSQPQYGKPSSQFQRAKKDFENLLMPKKDNENDQKPQQEYQWDFNPEDYAAYIDQPDVIDAGE